MLNRQLTLSVHHTEGTMTMHAGHPALPWTCLNLLDLDGQRIHNMLHQRSW